MRQTAHRLNYVTKLTKPSDNAKNTLAFRAGDVNDSSCKESNF